MWGLGGIRVASESERTLPVRRVYGNRRDLDKDLILADGWDRTLLRLDGAIRLDDDCLVCLWDLEVGHV